MQVAEAGLATARVAGGAVAAVLLPLFLSLSCCPLVSVLWFICCFFVFGFRWIDLVVM